MTKSREIASHGISGRLVYPFFSISGLVRLNWLCMQNFSILVNVQVVFLWWKKRRRKKIPVLMATLASAQTEFSWAGVGLRLTKTSFTKSIQLLKTNPKLVLKTGNGIIQTGNRIIQIENGIISPTSWPPIKKPSFTKSF